MVSLLAKQVEFDFTNVNQQALLVVCVLDGRGGWKSWWDTNKRNHLCPLLCGGGCHYQLTQPSLPTVFPHNHSYSHRLPSTVTSLPFFLFQTSLTIFRLLGFISTLHAPVSKSYTFYKVCLKESLLHDTPNKLSKIDQGRWNHCYSFL